MADINDTKPEAAKSAIEVGQRTAKVPPIFRAPPPKPVIPTRRASEPVPAAQTASKPSAPTAANRMAPPPPPRWVTPSTASDPRPSPGANAPTSQRTVTTPPPRRPMAPPPIARPVQQRPKIESIPLVETVAVEAEAFAPAPQVVAEESTIAVLPPVDIFEEAPFEVTVEPPVAEVVVPAPVVGEPEFVPSVASKPYIRQDPQAEARSIWRKFAGSQDDERLRCLSVIVKHSDQHQIVAEIEFEKGSAEVSILYPGRQFPPSRLSIDVVSSKAAAFLKEGHHDMGLNGFRTEKEQVVKKDGLKSEGVNGVEAPVVVEEKPTSVSKPADGVIPPSRDDIIAVVEGVTTDAHAMKAGKRARGILREMDVLEPSKASIMERFRSLDVRTEPRRGQAFMTLPDLHKASDEQLPEVAWLHAHMAAEGLVGIKGLTNRGMTVYMGADEASVVQEKASTFRKFALFVKDGCKALNQEVQPPQRRYSDTFEITQDDQVISDAIKAVRSSGMPVMLSEDCAKEMAMKALARHFEADGAFEGTVPQCHLTGSVTLFDGGHHVVMTSDDMASGHGVFVFNFGTLNNCVGIDAFYAGARMSWRGDTGWDFQPPSYVNEDENPVITAHRVDVAALSYAKDIYDQSLNSALETARVMAERLDSIESAILGIEESETNRLRQADSLNDERSHSSEKLASIKRFMAEPWPLLTTMVTKEAELGSMLCFPVAEKQARSAFMAEPEAPRKSQSLMRVG